MSRRILHTALLILAAPIAWAFGMVTYTAVSIGYTVQAIAKVWK